MNSQYLPGSNEILNKQAHDNLLKAAKQARMVKSKPIRRFFKRDVEIRSAGKIGPEAPTPKLLEPTISALLTIAVALQFAYLVAL